jgi:formylglycine-generating enzyme
MKMGHYALAFVLILSCFEYAVAAKANAWVRIPAGKYKPLFVPSEADPKGLIKLDESKKPSVLAKNVLVSVGEFDVQANPVTNRQFLNFVNQNSEWRRDRAKAIFADKRYLGHWKSPTSLSRQSSDQPVVNVSWFAASAYCESLGARLMTTDEWEYISSLDDPSKRDPLILEWYSLPNSDSPGFSERSFAGAMGVRDMYGKIWEWTLDFNSSMVTGESREDTSLSRSMFCGAGSIGSTNPSDYATFMRFAFRSGLKGNYALPALGFRCARGAL